jgi:histidine ammonia-lyase
VEDQLHDGQPHYGINTGFGSLAKQRINRDDLHTLQRNLIRSHTAGVGDPLREELVRAMMFLLTASLARGHSGVRPVVVQTLLAMLNAGVTPVVPSLGSVGASGDLAPLASVALCAIGEGRAVFNGRAMAAKDALKRARIKPLTLEAKEGLALINGTHLMAAEGALLIEDTQMLIGAASLALAMSIDACRASHSFLDARLYRARQQHGPMMEASLLRQHLDGSQIVTSHIDNDPRVQDPYSLRAGPTVLGAAADAVAAIARSIRDELGAVTDNPLVFASESKQGGRAPHSSHAAIPPIVSGANFHGMPLALPLDYLAIAIAQIAGISERRTYLMTGAFEPESHLKPFLAPRPGLQSGLMIAQYTAAACVNEIVTLSMPASVANVTTCAGMEDYNSFGPRSAAKARRALELARHVVAIELLCAAQGIECHRPLRSGRNVEHAIKLIRKHVKTLTEDRPLTGDIEAITSMIATGELELGA